MVLRRIGKSSTVTNWVTTGTAPPRRADWEDFFCCTAACCVDGEESQ